MASVVRTASPPKSPMMVRSDASVRLDGMHPDVHQAGLAPNWFIYLQNVRRIGPDIIGRPGQELFSDFSVDLSTPAYPVVGLFDMDMGHIHRLLSVGDGCPGVAPTTGQYMGSFATEQSPRYQRFVYKDTATSLTSVVFKKGSSTDGLLPPVNGVFFAVDNQLFRLKDVQTKYGADPFTATSGTREKLIWTAPAAYSRISAMVQQGSNLLVGVVGVAAAGVGTSAIFRWDGLTWTRDVTGINPVTGWGILRDIAVAGFAGAPNLIHIRDAAGTWTTMAPDFGTVSINGNHRCDSYNNELYIPSGENIYRFNGSTLIQIPVATTGITAGATVATCKRAFGYLFANWSTAAPINRLARFDGTTWVPAHYDFVALDATNREARAMAKFQGALFVACTTASSGIRLYRSQRRNTSLAYTSIDPSNVSSGDLTELVVF